MRVINLCIHCGNQCTGKYCSLCKTAESRKQMDLANKELFPDYVCKVCELGWDSVHVQRFSPFTIKQS